MWQRYSTKPNAGLQTYFRTAYTRRGQIVIPAELSEPHLAQKHVVGAVDRRHGGRFAANSRAHRDGATVRNKNFL